MYGTAQLNALILPCIDHMNVLADYQVLNLWTLYIASDNTAKIAQLLAEVSRAGLFRNLCISGCAWTQEPDFCCASVACAFCCCMQQMVGYLHIGGGLRLHLVLLDTRRTSGELKALGHVAQGMVGQQIISGLQH